MKPNWNKLNLFQKIFLYSKSYFARLPYYLSKIFSKNIEFKDGKNVIKFLNLGSKSFFRTKTILTKDPFTINWIKNFKKNSVFWDIGANIGIFSLYAAIKSNAKVYSFEPMPLNYKNLSVNISLNKLTDKIVPFCIALNEKNKFSNLYVKWLEEGFAGTSFNKPITISKKNGLKIKHFSLNIDTLVFKLGVPCPHYLKIDVDGNDFLILKGAKKTIKSSTVKSIMIEIPHTKDSQKSIEKQHITNKIKKYLESFQFYYVKSSGNNFLFKKK